jgi:hypothetical protein
MDKKEVFDYLAKTYLSSSHKDTLTRTPPPKRFHYRGMLLIALFFMLVAGSTFLYSSLTPQKGFSFREHSLSLTPADIPIAVNYDFTGTSDVKQSRYAFNFNPADVKDFAFLMLSMKQSHPKGALSVRVDMNTKRNEHDTFYVRNVGNSWKRFMIPLSEFKGISDFSDIVQLSFAIEEWNVEQKSGTLFIDNVGFGRR